MYDISIYADRLVTMNSKRDVIKHGYVGIKGNRIEYIGSDPIAAHKTIKKNDSILIPGMVNTHTHVPMTIMRGIADDMQLMHWLENYIFPTEAKFVNEEFVYWASKLAMMELIASGTTTFCDMFYFMNAIAKATNEAGVRAVLSGDCSLAYLQHLSVEERLERGLELNQQYTEEFKKFPTVKNALGPHSAYSVDEKYLRKISDLAQKNDLMISMHIAEIENEADVIHKKFGKKISTPIQYLDEIGFFEARVLSVHTIWPNEKDQTILLEKNVHVAHCPQSNLKISSGIAPIPQMLDKGIVIGLGTDGPASNNDMILWEDMTLAALLHKGFSRNPTVLPAQKVFEMATIDGAKALWLDNEIGSIEVGKKADLVLIDTSKPHQNPPSQNVYSQLVYSAKSSDVDTVMIDGKLVFEDRKYTTLNCDEILDYAKKTRLDVDQFLKQRNQ